MKRKQLKLCFVIILVFVYVGVIAQNMYVMENNGMQKSYVLSSLQKITFSAGNAIFYNSTTNPIAHEISKLRYFNFKNLLSSQNEKPYSDASTLPIYPNPVINVLNIDLTSKINDGRINILSLDGKLIQSHETKANTNMEINLSMLSQGIYLCCYKSSKENIIIKFIKL
ncbi:MAG: T9SS type A sorting domain-containing protein [Paludibacter sp.]